MADPMDDVEFLARSQNRFAVLDALTDEPHTRRELQTKTGASRVTIGRIVADLAERGWATEGDDGVAVTQIGSAVSAAFAELRATLTAADVLRPFAESLPDGFLSVDIRHFREAEVVLPSGSDPLAAARLATRLMGDADHIRVLGHAVTGETVAVQIRAASERGQRSDVVVSGNTGDAMTADPSMRDQLRTLVAMDEVTMYRYAGEAPLSIGIYDDATVAIGMIDDRSFPSAAIVSTDESVLEWAVETFEAFKNDAKQLLPADFPE